MGSSSISEARRPRRNYLALGGGRAAIKQKDGKRYAEAYGRLTEACNGCHQAARRGYVVIQEPKGSFFADQDFHVNP